MIKGRTFEYYDRSKPCKVKAQTPEYINGCEFELEKYEIYEFDYIPICSENTRNDLKKRFTGIPLQSEIWDWIDRFYSSHFENLNYSFHKKLKVDPDRDSLIQHTIDKLKSLNIREKNIDFYDNYVSLMYDFIERQPKDFNELVNSNPNSKKLSDFKPYPAWTDLYESIKNLAILNFIKVLEEMHQDKNDEVKITLKDVFKSKEILEKVLEKMSEITYNGLPIINNKNGKYEIPIQAKYDLLAVLKSICIKKTWLKTSNTKRLAEAFCNQFDLHVPVTPKQFEPSYNKYTLDKFFKLLKPLYSI